MSKPIFFIDGQTEKLILQDICPGRPIRITGLNGKSVTIPAIAKKIAPLIKMLGGKYYPIVVLIDRESRPEEFDAIAKELKDCLEELGLENEDLRIGVADRMLENWILADWETLTGEKSPPNCMEGRNGAAELRKMLGCFNKTTDGVELFKKSRQSIMYTKSQSYKHFIDQLDGVACEYLNFEKLRN